MHFVYIHLGIPVSVSLADLARHELQLSVPPHRAIFGVLYAEPLPQLARTIVQPAAFPIASPHLVSPVITPATHHTVRVQSGHQMIGVKNINLYTDRCLAICGVVMRIFLRANTFAPVLGDTGIAGELLVRDTTGFAMICVPAQVLCDMWYLRDDVSTHW